MSYREIIEPLPAYLHVRCSGTWDLTSSEQCWRNIAAALEKTPHGLVLLDDRELEVRTSTNVEFEHASFVAELLRGQCRRIAILDTESRSEDMEFFETVCVNRGLSMKFFQREQEAVDWLTA